MEPQMIRKALLGDGLVKGIDSAKRRITAYASTKDWDRYGERFEADAFKDGLTAYRANPVILWAHEYWTPPIGKAVGFDFDSKGLILEMEFADTPHAKDIFALYEGGYMRAFSVGFKPKEVAYEERVAGSGQMGAVFKQAELLENSAVPVPANPGALVIKGLMDAAHRVFSPGAAAPQGWKDFEAFRDEQASLAQARAAFVAEGPAASLKGTLGYLLSLAKTIKGAGKIEDEAVRSLIVQTNNALRELAFGKGAESLDGMDGELTGDEASALVREYELLSDKVFKDGRATDKDREEFVALGKTIEGLLAK